MHAPHTFVLVNRSCSSVGFLSYSVNSLVFPSGFLLIVCPVANRRKGEAGQKLNPCTLVLVKTSCSTIVF